MDEDKVLEEIANDLGASVEELLEEYGSATTIIEKYESGELHILNG